jgi:uncharacterized protein YndB with AHSA1/START domain
LAGLKRLVNPGRLVDRGRWVGRGWLGGPRELASPSRLVNRRQVVDRGQVVGLGRLIGPRELASPSRLVNRGQVVDLGRLIGPTRLVNRGQLVNQRCADKPNWSDEMSDPGVRPVYPHGYHPSPITEPRRSFTDGRWTIILTRELRHPVKRVWEALTEPGQLRQWAPFTADRDLTTTGEVTMTMLDVNESGEPTEPLIADGQAMADGQAVEGETGERGADSSSDASQSGYVLEVDPPHLLVYRWGEDVLCWELASTEDGTRLILKHTLHDEDFSSAVAAGWHLCLDVADALMKGVPFGPVIGSRAKLYGWDDLNQRYAELLGVMPSFT